MLQWHLHCNRDSHSETGVAREFYGVVGLQVTVTSWEQWQVTVTRCGQVQSHCEVSFACHFATASHYLWLWAVAGTVSCLRQRRSQSCPVLLAGAVVLAVPQTWQLHSQTQSRFVKNCASLCSRCLRLQNHSCQEVQTFDSATAGPTHTPFISCERLLITLAEVGGICMPLLV